MPCACFVDVLSMFQSLSSFSYVCLFIEFLGYNSDPSKNWPGTSSKDDSGAKPLKGG